MIKVINNEESKKVVELDVGQVWARVEEPDKLYMICCLSTDENWNYRQYALINLQGHGYISLVDDINKVFGRYQDKFFLVEKDITITVG